MFNVHHQGTCIACVLYTMEFYPTPNITWKWFFFFSINVASFWCEALSLDDWLFFMTASSATFSKVVLRNYSIFQYFFMCLLLLPHFWASVDILAMLFTFQTIITIITNTCTNSFLPKYNTISILFQFLSACILLLICMRKRMIGC